MHPVRSIRRADASFLQKFTVSENSLRMLFANDARRQLHYIFIQFCDNIQTARQLRNADFAKFFNKSQLFLINYVCYFMRYRVIYFQCLCYFALPLCIVSMHLTRCVLVSFFFLCF